MGTRLSHGLSVAVLSVICMLAGVFSSFAASFSGSLDPVSDSVISGWAIDQDNPDKAVEVVLYLYEDNKTTAKELARVKADQYRSDSANTPQNGNHSFSYTINWNEFNGSEFVIQAYVLSDGRPTVLAGSAEYSKTGAVKSDSSVATGPAALPAEDTAVVQASLPAQPELPEIERGTKGAYLGKFYTTAYCSCNRCSSGTGRTYSGAMAKSNHTISADISLYPIGTKLIIGDIVYTVEDIGTGVNGKKLDIFFDSHQEALNYGVKTVDVYAAE